MNTPFRIWDDDLIPNLCSPHLIEAWYCCWIVHDWLIKKVRVDHPSFEEFEAFPIHLIFRMNKLYKESKKFKLDWNNPPDLYDMIDEPLFKIWKELKLYVPWQSKQHQIDILRKEGCTCSV